MNESKLCSGGGISPNSVGRDAQNRPIVACEFCDGEWLTLVSIDGVVPGDRLPGHEPVGVALTVEMCPGSGAALERVEYDDWDRPNVAEGKCAKCEMVWPMRSPDGGRLEVAPEHTAVSS